MLGFFGVSFPSFIPALLLLSAAAAELPPTYVCQRTEEPPVIDGRGDEAVWQRARKLSHLRDIEGAYTGNETEIRMLWDDENLYVLADIPEKNLWGTLTEHDSCIFRDPDFEVFIDPNEEGNNYMELEINQLNTVWDLFIARTYRHAPSVVLHDWDIKGLQHAVQLRGTLNKADDTDEGWSVELAIPWRSIIGNGIHPRQDAPPTPYRSMRFNFSCVNWQTEPADTPCGYRKKTNAAGRTLPESNQVWAPTGKINIHLPEHWGRVVFSPHPAGTWEPAPTDPEAALRLALYRYYDSQKEYYHRHSRFAVTDNEHAAAGMEKPKGAECCLDKEFFVLRGFCPRSGRQLVLDSQGQFRATPKGYPLPNIYLWVHGGDDTATPALWQQRFADYQAAGVDTVIIDGSYEHIRTLTPLAREAGLEVAAWFWALNRPQAGEQERHPDWYAVSREGKSCARAEDCPYVPYYRFLCPNHPQVRAFLRAEAAKLASVEGVSAVQLDYMRLPDVILPRGLWENYGLEMHTELPPYDFCYCNRCRRLFRQRYGREIAADAPQDADWREFRLQSVADVAAELCGTIRSQGKRALCAVFPTPEIAAELVRQDWSRFPLDMALPMNYHAFYREGPEWITACYAAADEQTQGRMPLAPGLHLPDLPPDQLTAKLIRLRRMGAQGIGLFSSEEFTPAHQKALHDWKAKAAADAKKR